MFLNFIFLIFILFLIKCYRRTQDHIYENRSSSSSKHDWDVDVRRKKDPRTERKKDEQSRMYRRTRRERDLCHLPLKLKDSKKQFRKIKEINETAPYSAYAGFKHMNMVCWNAQNAEDTRMPNAIEQMTYPSSIFAEELCCKNQKGK